MPEYSRNEVKQVWFLLPHFFNLLFFLDLDIIKLKRKKNCKKRGRICLIAKTCKLTIVFYYKMCLFNWKGYDFIIKRYIYK